MSQLIQKALLKAIELHKDQFRKGSDKIPYVVHPLEVAIILSRFTSDETIIASALLHDAIEDTGYTKEQMTEDFNADISFIVSFLTEDKSIEDYNERKRESLERIKQNKIAAIIKSIDGLVNMKDLISLIKDKGGEAWNLFNGTKEEKMEYFQAILELAKLDMPADLLAEYVTTLKDLEYSEYLNQNPAIGFCK